MRFLRGLLATSSKEHSIRRPVKYSDYVAFNLTLPEITDDMIENAEIFENGNVRFYFPDVPENIKEILIKEVKSSDRYNLEDDEIERYVFDLEANTDGKNITYATMGVSVVVKPDENSTNEFAGEYDYLIVVFDSLEECEAVMRALLLVKSKKM